MADLAEVLLASLPKKKQKVCIETLVGFKPRERGVVVTVLLERIAPSERVECISVISVLISAETKRISQ